MHYLLPTNVHHHFPLFSTIPTITNHLYSHKCNSKLDPNAESFKPQKKFSFIFNNNNKKIADRFYYDNDYDDDDEEEEEEEGISDGIEQWIEVWEEYIGSIWFFKVIGSYGWASPIILLSILLASGPKAFLMALALPLGQSTVSFAFQKIQGSAKNRSKRKRRTMKKSRSYRSRTAEQKRTTKVRTGYQSWVPRRDVAADDLGHKAPSSFGGWDELDGNMDVSGGSSMKSDPTLGRSRKASPEEGKFHSLGHKGETPLLLRLIISVFPFLSSWTKIL